MPTLNGVLSLVLSGGCLHYGSMSLLAGTPAPMGTQPAQAVWLLKADFFISAMQKLLPHWQDPALAHLHRIFPVVLAKGSQDGQVISAEHRHETA